MLDAVERGCKRLLRGFVELDVVRRHGVRVKAHGLADDEGHVFGFGLADGFRGTLVLVGSVEHLVYNGRTWLGDGAEPNGLGNVG